MIARMGMTLAVVSAVLMAAEPGYLEVNFYHLRTGKGQARRELLKKINAPLDGFGAEPGTRSLRMIRRYPQGNEHGYNDLLLTFRDEPRELDPAKLDPARSPEALSKAIGSTPAQRLAEMDAIWDTSATHNRLFREVVSLGKIEAGDWIRVNWIRAAPGKRQAIRDANVKYLQAAAKKHIEQGLEKGWLFYQLSLPSSESDFDFLRVHIFRDSKSAQKLLGPSTRGASLPEILSPPDYANMPRPCGMRRPIRASRSIRWNT